MRSRAVVLASLAAARQRAPSARHSVKYADPPTPKDYFAKGYERAHEALMGLAAPPRDAGTD